MKSAAKAYTNQVAYSITWPGEGKQLRLRLKTPRGLCDAFSLDLLPILTRARGLRSLRRTEPSKSAANLSLLIRSAKASKRKRKRKSPDLLAIWLEVLSQHNNSGRGSGRKRGSKGRSSVSR